MTQRTIKFRAWDKEKEYMVIEAIEFRSDRVKNTLLGSNYEYMQFTGLLDKAGREVFEGDVLTDYSLVDDLGNETVYSIGFNNGAFRIEKTNCTCGCIGTVVEGTSESKIIGNVMENPELLS